ncbi:MAG: cytochrome c maturation protein CcmE [Chloroflexi bacterium]|nr:cytochrome c maturation protein CcmE [Chloroflexota bacterium]
MTTAITTPPPKGGWFKRANKKLIAVVVIVIVAIGILIGTSLRGALTYYITVDELTAKGAEGYNDRVRVGGRVLKGTIVKDAQNNLTFCMYHNEPSNLLPVSYKGVVPDIFGDETDVIVEGKRLHDGTFRAIKLLSQHPPEFRLAEPGKPHAPVDERK